MPCPRSSEQGESAELDDLILVSELDLILRIGPGPVEVEDEPGEVGSLESGPAVVDLCELIPVLSVVRAEDLPVLGVPLGIIGGVVRGLEGVLGGADRLPEGEFDLARSLAGEAVFGIYDAVEEVFAVLVVVPLHVVIDVRTVSLKSSTNSIKPSCWKCISRNE